MLKSIYISVVSFALIHSITAQTYKRNLLSANSFTKGQDLYIYGYEQQKNNLKFRCFSFNKKLVQKDSIDFDLGNHTPADFVDISSDTLHGVVNFYFQEANQKNLVTLLRLNDTLGKICSTENYDANHINSLSAFDDEKYYYTNSLYIIKEVKTDTSSNQFYLSKYQIQNMNKPFEYDFKWQFAFDRQYIHRASVLYADSMQVIIYAHVNDGPKKGQWILRINAINGELLNGTRLNGKIDTRHFLISNFHYDNKTGNISLIGNIYGTEMIDFIKKTSNFLNLSKRNTLFFITIDASGDIKTKTEQLIALPIQINTGKSLISYHLKIREFKKISETDYDIWADMYELTDPKTLSYYTSWHITIKPNDVDYAITPDKFFICSKTLPKLISSSETDTYGKFIMKDISDYDKFKYKPLLSSVVVRTGNDDLQNPYYILKKTDISQATKIYYHVFMGKKELESKIILKAEQSQKANVFFINDLSYISFITNFANSEFELKLHKL